MITLSCPHCGFSKEIEKSRIPAGTNNIKCPKCQQSFSLDQTFKFEPDPTAAAAPQPQQEAAKKTAPSEAKNCPTCGQGIHIKAEICPGCGVRVAPPAHTISKLALLLITFFLGGIGGHKFYQKKYWLGALYLLFFWTYIPSLVAFIEFVLYAFRSEEELQRRYPETSGNAIIFAVIVPMFGIAIIGILAAIAIPQFAAYREKAFSAQAMNALQTCKSEAEGYFTDQRSYPTRYGQLDCQPSEGVALYYLSLGPEDFQIISFHDKGKKAFLTNSGDAALEENSREEIESQLKIEFGDSALERTFHFIE